MTSKGNEKDNKKVKKVGDILRSSSATNLVKELNDKEQSFSELQKNLKMTSGRLNYHLLKLQTAGILKKTRGERYALTNIGAKVSEIVRRTLKEAESLEEER